jgi:cell division protein FtsL
VIVRTLAFSFLLLLTVASAIGVVYARQQSRVAFIALSQLGNDRDNLNFEFGRLQLEQATWAENNRIEQIARGKLGMVSPSVAESVVIKR